MYVLVFRDELSHRFLTIVVPKLFEANHRPPEFNMVKDALHAVGQATVLSISSFAFLVSGTLWVMNIQDTKHFSQTMIKMLGGEKRREELLNMPVAPEVKEIENDLNSLFKN